jgi:hypothetical protein
MTDFLFPKPIGQLQQIGGHGSKTANLATLAIFLPANNAGIDALLVHIQSSAAGA